MTLPPLAVPTDVAAMLGRDLTTPETAFASSLIAMGSGLVRSYTRQQITQTLGDTITLAGNWGQRIDLPQRPVTGITSVTVNGATLDLTKYQWDRSGSIYVTSGSFMPDSSGSLAGGIPQLWGPAGAVYQNFSGGASWGGPAATITVVYDHGYSTVPPEISNEIAGMVALQMSTGAGIDSETIGSYKVSYVRTPTGGLSLSDASKKVLDVFRKRAATVSAATVR
jgi:hypothetical protein